MLNSVKSATGLDLAIDDRLAEKTPSFGRLPSSFKTWQIMEFMVQKQLLPARWESTENGYRLVSVAPFGSRSTPWAISAAALAVFALSFCLATRFYQGAIPATFFQALKVRVPQTYPFLYRATAMTGLTLTCATGLWLASRPAARPADNWGLTIDAEDLHPGSVLETGSFRRKLTIRNPTRVDVHITSFALC